MDPHFDGVIFQTYGAELERRRQRPFPPFVLLDVRSPEAYAGGHIPGARPVAPGELEAALPAGGGTSTETFVIGDGPADPRLRAASLALQAHGVHRIVEFTGGMLEWRESGYPEETGSAAAAA